MLSKYLLHMWIHIFLFLFGFCCHALSTHFVLGCGWGLCSIPWLQVCISLNPWQPSKSAIITPIPQSRKGSIREETSTPRCYLADKRQNQDLNPCLEAFFHETSAQSFCKWDFLTVSTRRPSQFCRQTFSFSSSFQAKYGSETLEEPIATEIPTRTTQ